MGIVIILLVVIIAFFAFNSSNGSNNFTDCGNLETVVNTPTTAQQEVLTCWKNNLESCSPSSIDWTASTDGSQGQDKIISKEGSYCKISSSAGGKTYSCDVPQDFIQSIVNNPSIGSGFFATIDLTLWTGKINRVDYNNGQEVILNCND